MFKQLLLGLFATLLVNAIAVSQTYGQSEDDVLTFLPAILSGIEPPPPPPPRPAQWQITNSTVCFSRRSTWRVDDSENVRVASVNSSSVFTPPVTSSIVSVPAGTRNFEWSLTTETSGFTCGNFGGEFTIDLKPGFRYSFNLTPNGSGA